MIYNTLKCFICL